VQTENIDILNLRDKAAGGLVECLRSDEKANNAVGVHIFQMLVRGFENLTTI
jgi:hypothetical protein